VLLVAALSLAAGCGGGDSEVIECTPTTMCLKGGVPGRCAVSPASAKSYCAYPDPVCPSGERWGLFAGEGLADICLGAADGGMLDSSASGLSFDRTSHDFGSVAPAAVSTAQLLTLTNNGSASSGAVAVTLGGGGSAAFTTMEDGCAGNDLAAGASCSLRVQFRPTAAGLAQATLTASAGGQSAPVELRGTGAAVAMLGIMPTVQDFGMVVTSMSSGEITFTVTNRGDMTSGNLTASVTGIDAAAFAVTSDTCSSNPLVSAASCAVKLRFSPTAAGAKAGTLTVSSTPGGMVTVALSGTAVAAGALSVDRTTNPFGSLAIGTTSAVAMFTFTNTGATPSGTLGTALSDTTNYAIASNTCIGTLAASATCVIRVTFNPTTVGSKLASLTLSATPGGNAIVSLTGTGTALLRVVKTGNGGGQVTSNPAGIDCGVTCQFDSAFASVVISASPSPSSTFQGWAGGGCTGMGNCTVTMDAAKTVMAAFNDSAAPTVLSTSPAAGAVNGQPGSVISVTFSEELDATSVNASSFQVRRGTSSIAGTISVSGATVSFRATDPLPLLGLISGSIATTVRDLAGNSLAAPFSWSFRVRDGVWGVPVLLDSAAGRVGGASVASNVRGDAVAVWFQSDGARDNIWAATRARGATWSAAVLVEGDDGDANLPSVAMDPAGNAVAVWRQTEGPRINVRASRFSAGGTWGAATTIETVDVDAYAPAVGMDAAGNATAAWIVIDASTGDVYANRYSPGSGWGTAVSVDAGAGKASSTAALSVNTAGIALVSFVQFDGLRNNLYVSRFIPGAGWETGVQAEVEDSMAALGFPSANITNGGAEFVTWIHGSNAIWWNRSVNRAWQTAAPVGTGDLLHRSCADESGDLIIAWRETSNVNVRRYAAGSALGTVQVLGAGDPPRVKCDGDGNAMLTTSNGADLVSYRFSASAGTWGPAVPADSLPTAVTGTSQESLSIDGTGAATTVWVQTDVNQNLYVNRFE